MDDSSSRSVRGRVVRASALYDLVVTAPFATPWSTRLVAGSLEHVHGALGLAGAPPRLDVLGTLFANLMGSLVLVWAVVRLRDPSRAHGVADTLARLAFSAWMATALAAGASQVLLGFLLLELAWAVLQGVAVLGEARPKAVVMLTNSP